MRRRDADALPLRVRLGGSRPAHRPVFPVITALMPKRTSALAITSLVTGILGWSFLPFVGSIVAIITGHMARAEIRRNWDSIDGYGLALVGLCLGWAAIILSVLAVLMVLLVFGGLAARKVPTPPGHGARAATATSPRAGCALPPEAEVA